MTLSDAMQGWVSGVAREEIAFIGANVISFGAVPDGVTDCTAAFQAASDAAGANGVVRIPKGTYFLSATVQGYANQHWIGDGRNSTTIKRTGNYGDTLNFAAGQACTVRGIFFRHGTDYANASPGPLDYLATSGAHIRLNNVQGANIVDCWLWRMPYGVVIESGALTVIDNCDMRSTWDAKDVTRQEGVASVLVGNSGYTQITKIRNCYFGGYLSESRNVTYTSTDGVVTVNHRENIGPKNGVRVIQCEALDISNNYFSNHGAANFATGLVSGSVNMSWKFIGNTFDGAIASGINFRTAADGAFINSVVINCNVFNGEMQTLNAISVYNALGSQPIITNFTITGNTMQATVGTPVMIYQATGGVISGNSITGYNCLGASAGADYSYSAAVNFLADASWVNCLANTVGGAVNTATPTAICYNAIKKHSSLALPATVIDSNNLFIA